jgi:hypothetical protein
VDFLIEFPPNQDLGPWLAHYFDLKAEFEKLLGRNTAFPWKTRVAGAAPTQRPRPQGGRGLSIADASPDSLQTLSGLAPKRIITRGAAPRLGKSTRLETVSR